MSRACQNSAKQSKRRRMSARKPFAETCAIMVRSQSMPAETWMPWHPTRAKKEDRKALRVGPAPRATRPENSWPSRARNAKPRRQVTRHRSLKPALIAHAGGNARKAAGETREQQTPGFDGDIPQVKQLRPAWPSGCLSDQHGVASEEAREHYNVAKKEKPKTIAGNDPLRSRPIVSHNGFTRDTRVAQGCPPRRRL